MEHIQPLFFFNDTATTEIYTLSLHDALPIWTSSESGPKKPSSVSRRRPGASAARSEEHTSELQSRSDLVCRLLLEKKKQRGNQLINLEGFPADALLAHLVLRPTGCDTCDLDP